jgi:hypothetical protein
MGAKTMAGDKERKGFSGLLDLASEVSDIYELVRSEPKEEAIKDSDIHETKKTEQNEGAIKDTDVKKDFHAVSQSAGVKIGTSRALPPPNTVSHGDSDESEATGVNRAFGLMFATLLAICILLSMFHSGSKVETDRVITSSKPDRDTRENGSGNGDSLLDFPINTSPDSTALPQDLPQKSIISHNSQGSVVLPKNEGNFSPKENESNALAGSVRTEDRPLFSGSEKGQARLERVDNGSVVLSDGRRYAIAGLSRSDFSHLMLRYDAKSIGFETPLRFIDEERTWWDNSLTYSRNARIFAKSGDLIILFSVKKNGYFHVEYSKLSPRDRRYIDAIEFSRHSNDPFLDVAPDSYKDLGPYDYVFPSNNPFDD